MTSKKALSTTEFYQNNEWQTSVDLPTPLRDHCLLKLNSSHVFLSGGISKRLGKLSSPTNASYIYSRATGFVRQGDMGTERSSHGCALQGDKVWVAGGFVGATSSEYFSLSTSTWLPGPDLPKYEFGRMITYDGKVTFFGYFFSKIWQLEAAMLDSVDGWTWVEVGETKALKHSPWHAIKMKQKDCNNWNNI